MIQTVLITAGLFFLGWGLWLKRPFAARPTKAGWTLSHIAWVSGGPSRVLETWWLAARANKWLVPCDTKSTRWRVSVGAAHEDAWLSRAMASLPQAHLLTTSEVFKRWGQELGDLHKQLHTGRLVVGSYDRQQRHLAALIGVVGMLVASFMGSGLWIWVCWSAALGTLLALWWVKVPYLTTAGLKLSKQWRLDHRAATLAPTDDSVVLAMALGGSVVLAGTPFNTYASPDANKTNSRSSGCGSSGCGASSGAWADASSGSSGGWSTGGSVDGGSHSSGCGSSDGGGSSGCGGGGCGGGGCGG